LYKELELFVYFFIKNIYFFFSVFLPFWIYFVGKRSFFVERVNIGIFPLIYCLLLIFIPFFFGILMSKLGCQKVLLQKYSKYLKVEQNIF